MKILFLAAAIDTHTRRFSQMLLDAGHTVIYVARQNPDLIESEKYTFIQFPDIPYKKWMRPYRFFNILREWGIALRLRLIWQRVKPDIAHILYVDRRAYYCSLARIHPLVLTALGSDINDPFEKDDQDSGWPQKMAKALQTADHITSDTREILQRCELLAGKPLSTSLFYFGIDLDLFKPRSMDEKNTLRKTLGIPLEAKVVLSPRRISSKMRHDLVLNAFSKINRKNKLDVMLVLRRFGGYPLSYEQYLNELAQELKINDQLIWVSEIDYAQIPVLYSLANVVINVPEQDGLPVTLFEASACRTPVITSDLPAYQEYLAEGSYFRVPVGNLNALVDGMQSILDEENDGMTEILQKNYDLVVQKADQKECLLNIERVYQGLANR